MGSRIDSNRDFILQEISGRIRDRRNELNKKLYPGQYRQQDCVEKCNNFIDTYFFGIVHFDRQSWNKMENGIEVGKFSKPEILVTIASVLKCSTDYLLTGKDKPPVKPQEYSIRDICSVLSYLAFAYPMEIMDMGDKSIGVGIRFAPVDMEKLYPQLNGFRGESDRPTDEIIKFLHGLKSAMETDEREKPCFPAEPLCGYPLSRQAAADVSMLLNNTSTATPADIRLYEYNRLQEMNNDGNLPPEIAENSNNCHKSL